jgi:hypothetical protein
MSVCRPRRTAPHGADGLFPKPQIWLSFVIQGHPVFQKPSETALSPGRKRGVTYSRPDTGTCMPPQERFRARPSGRTSNRVLRLKLPVSFRTAAEAASLFSRCNINLPYWTGLWQAPPNAFSREILVFKSSIHAYTARLMLLCGSLKDGPVFNCRPSILDEAGCRCTTETGLRRLRPSHAPCFAYSTCPSQNAILAPPLCHWPTSGAPKAGR